MFYYHEAVVFDQRLCYCFCHRGSICMSEHLQKAMNYSGILYKRQPQL